MKTLRPEARHTFDSGIGEGTVLMVTDPQLRETEITVEVTAKGIDGISRQTFSQPVGEPVDLTTDLLAGMVDLLPKPIAAELVRRSATLGAEDHETP